MYKTIQLRKGRENVLKRKHPWIFSRALYKPDPDLRDGEIVRVEDYKNNFLAMATFHRSSIALRILAFTERKIDKSFFTEKLLSAKKLRSILNLPSRDTNCFRAIHGEGDGLSGLVIDIYHNTAVIQCHHMGMYHLKKEIADSILNTYPQIVKNIYLRNTRSMSSQNKDLQDGYIYKDSVHPPDDKIVENGIKFIVDWEKGQKTGFFLDQRENRQLLASYTKDKEVLNCFSYTGGFSMYALAGKARQVTSIDISDPAIQTLQQNAELNGVAHKSIGITTDVMDYLKEQKTKQWDVIVVDPPAFAKNISKKHKAVIAYKRLNAKALKLVKKGGLLFTFSCSQVVDTELFYNTITAASIEAGRKIRVIHKLMQGPDHPVNIFHPEGSYLKGLVLYID